MIGELLEFFQVVAVFLAGALGVLVMLLAAMFIGWRVFLFVVDRTS